MLTYILVNHHLLNSDNINMFVSVFIKFRFVKWSYSSNKLYCLIILEK